jgi:hypothetical protein
VIEVTRFIHSSILWLRSAIMARIAAFARAAQYNISSRSLGVLGCVLALSLSILSPTAFAVCNPSRLGPAVSKSTVNEAGGDSVTLQARITCKPGNWTFNWSIGGTAVNGVDYTAAATSGTVTGLSGVGLHNIVTVYPIDNSLRDGSRTITFNISGKGSATSTIIDDDAPNVTLSATDAAASETGPDTGTYTLSSDKTILDATAVNFTVPAPRRSILTIP